MSIEADVAFREDVDASKADAVDGAVGELPQFHETYGPRQTIPHDVHVMGDNGDRLTARRLPEGLDGIARFHAMIAGHATDPAR